MSELQSAHVKNHKKIELLRFRVKMYKCTKCGNQFREYFMESTLRLVLSAHNGDLGKTRVGKETRNRFKTYQ
jgi:hypothetical protein